MNLEVGDAVRGEVVSIKPYGAFVKLPNGEVGLAHVSEVADEYVKDITEYLMVGQEVIAKIIGRNAEGKLNLSLKRITKQDEAAAQYQLEMEEFRKKRQAIHTAHVFTNAQSSKSVGEALASSERQHALILWIKQARSTLKELERKGRLKGGGYG